MKRFTLLFLLLLALAAPAGTAMAAPLFDDGDKIGAGETVNNDVVIVDGDLEIGENATVNGDVILFNGDLDVGIGAKVNGDVVVMNGHADIDGAITGDIILFNGDLNAGETAVVQGDCALLNGELSGGASRTGLNCADVSGAPDFLNGFSAPVVPPVSPTVPDTPTLPDHPHERVERHHGPGFFGRVATAAVQSLFMGFLALITALTFPQHLRRVEETARQKKLASGAMGLLTAVAVPALLTFLILVSAILTLVCIGLLGFPIVFLLGMAFAVAAFLGWVAIGSWLGGKLAKLLKLKKVTLPVTAVLGMMTMTFVFGLTGPIGAIAAGLLGFVGLGAATLTRFGTRPYPLVAVATGRATYADEAPTEDPDKINVVMETLHIEEDDLE